MCRGRSGRSLVAALSCLTALGGSGAALAGGYTFVDIANTSGAYASFSLGEPALADDATVAFNALLDGAGGQGIFKGSGGAADPVALSAGGFSGFLQGIAMNGDGLVAFIGTLDAGPTGVFTGGVGPIDTVFDTTGPFGGPTPFLDISDNGVVTGVVSLDSGGQGIFADTATIASDAGAPYFNFEGPSINDSGDVAFIARLDADPSSPEIRVISGGVPTTIADTTGPIAGTFGLPHINDSGVVAFRAALDGGGVGIFTGDGGPLDTVVDTSGPFGDLASNGSVAINASGMVAFHGTLDTNETGLFVGPDPVADKVILSGDPLFGSTLQALSFRRALNDRGDLAFRYILDNGVDGVALAVATVPEPAAALQGLIGGLVLTGFAAARRRLRPS